MFAWSVPVWYTHLLDGGGAMRHVLGYAGQRVVVTVAASGMGEAAARLLVELGAEVHALDLKSTGASG